MELERKNELAAMAGSMSITGLLILLLTLIGFTTPNPPFPQEPGGLEISLGEAYMGGPDDVAARLGGEYSPEQSAAPMTGGGVDVLTQDDAEPTVVLPPINPPRRDRPAEVVTHDKPQPVQPTTDLPSINRSRNRGSGQQGMENGDPNGTGLNGRGDGVQRGNQGDPQGTGDDPNGVRGGLIGNSTFRGTRPSTNLRSLGADGEGNIIVRLKIDCNGQVVAIEDTDVRGSTYNAVDQDEIARMLIRNLKFTAITNGDCPQIGQITFQLRRGY
jgi:hypothetical protein